MEFADQTEDMAGCVRRIHLIRSIHVTRLRQWIYQHQVSKSRLLPWALSQSATPMPTRSSLNTSTSC